MKIFSAVRGLEVLSKPIYFEATSAHPKFLRRGARLTDL